MRIFVLFAVALSAFAQTPAAKPEPAKPVAESQALRLDNLWLKSQLIQKDLDALNQQFQQVIQGICNEAKLPLDKCNVGKDPSTGAWAYARIPDAPKTEAKADPSKGSK